MVRVAGSTPVVRSGRGAVASPRALGGATGGMAEWLGKGLQNPVPRFDSGCRLSVWDAGPGKRGRLAQGESASLTRKRSVVRIHYRPLQKAAICR